MYVHPVGGQTERAPAEWTPDRALVQRLADAADVEGYTIQPPKGFRMQRMQRANAPANPKMFAWVGDTRKDGARPSVTLMIAVPPPGESVNLPLEQVAEKLLGGVKRGRANWRQDTPERGVVNGMNFVRIRWSGMEPGRTRKMEGFIYVALDGTSVIQLGSQDVVPHGKQTLPLAEASVLTFRKP
jgi:hypothetical protein